MVARTKDTHWRGSLGNPVPTSEPFGPMHAVLIQFILISSPSSLTNDLLLCSA